MQKQIFLLLCFLSIQLLGQSDQIEKDKSNSIPENAIFSEKQKEFYDKWENRTPEKGLGYNVFKRWENQTAPRVYPSGDTRLLATTYENFITWRKENPQVATRSAPNAWFSLGPMAIPSGYDAGVGRVDFIKFHPSNTDIIFIGTPDGGLWKTVNGGGSWTTQTNFLGVIGCSDLVIDPNSPNTMYLATGNWEEDRRSIGVLKTVDGGNTWNTTGLTWSALDNYKIRRMVMDPSNSNLMMVVTDGGVFRTTDGWTSAVNNLELDGNYNLYDIKFKPGNSNVVYASGIGGSEVFWVSTNKGLNWAATTIGLPSGSSVSRIIIGVSADDADYVYLLAGDNDGGYLGLYRSTDQGLNFSARSTTPNLLNSSSDGSGTGGQASHDLAIAVSPTNVDDVIIGGINQWRSSNGGSTWSLFTYWLGIDSNYPGAGEFAPYIHADIQDVQYLPGSSTTLFVSSDGGIYKSTDNGATFAAISSNLSVAQQTNVAQSAMTKTTIVTGLQDIGTIKKSGSSYSVINGGDGESAFIDRSSDNVIVTSNPYGSHQISFNGNEDRQDITGLPAGTEFYCPVSQDPNNIDIIYAGGRPAMYKNVNFFTDPNTWVSIGTPPGTGSVLEYVVATGNSDVIYTIKETAIGKTIDGGNNWTNVTNGLPLGSARPTQITVSNTDPNKVWITFSGYNASAKVWKSTDGGASWSNLSSGLPNLPFNTVVYVKDSPVDEIYVGGDIGVYQYQNSVVAKGPGAWTNYNSGLPNTKVTDLEIFYPGTGSPELRAATYGRGTWATEIQPSVVPVELVSFTGEVRDNGNLLEWSSAEEIDLEVYEIQSSVDGKDYEMVGKKSPQSANSSDLQSYTFLDRNPATGLNYYRLKMIDLDGTFEYSTKVVLYNEDRESNVTINPNPSYDFIRINGLSKGMVNLNIRDVSGRAIFSKQIDSSEQISVNTLPNGNYFIEIQSANRPVIVKKFIKI